MSYSKTTMEKAKAQQKPAAFMVRSFTPQISRTSSSGNGTIYGEHPVRVFKVGDTALDTPFGQQLIPSFVELDWDLYDVRRQELQAIEAHVDLSAKERELLLSYYQGDIQRAKIKSLLDKLPAEIDAKLSGLRPTRKKACSHFRLSRIGDDNWTVEQQEKTCVTQNVSISDYRSIPRKYKPIPDKLVEQTGFKNVVAGVISMITEARPEAKSVDITIWMMSCYTWPDMQTTNSPEGIHQDGADYIVSALVVERNNVKGGSSRVYKGDLTRPIVEHTLQPGEGIFHADASSPLFHDVTPITVEDHTKPYGVRSLLGFDVYFSQAQ